MPARKPKPRRAVAPKPPKIPEHPYVMDARAAGLLLASGLVPSLAGALVRLLPGFVVEGEYLSLGSDRQLAFRGLRLSALEGLFEQIGGPCHGPSLHEVRVRLMGALDPARLTHWSFADEHRIAGNQPAAWRYEPLQPDDPDMGCAHGQEGSSTRKATFWRNKSLLAVIPDRGMSGPYEDAYRIERPEDGLRLGWNGCALLPRTVLEACTMADAAMRDGVPVHLYGRDPVGPWMDVASSRWEGSVPLARKSRAA